MARPIDKLTALTISRARRDGRYGDGGGLYLQVDGGANLGCFGTSVPVNQLHGVRLVDVVSVDEAGPGPGMPHTAHAGVDPVAAREAERAKKQSRPLRR